MSDWSLRLARAGDAVSLPAVETSAGIIFQSDPDLSDIAGQEPMPAERHRQLIAKGHCLVALSDDRIVGFVANEPFGRELHIWEMSVHADHQGGGIDAGLLRACQIDARNAGYAAITLTTFRDVAWNGPFYQRLGFVEVENFKSHPRLADVLDQEVEHGLPSERRIAMIHFLD